MYLFFAIIGAICWGIAPLLSKIGLQGVNPVIGLMIRTVITMSLVSFFIIITGSTHQVKHIPLTSFLMLSAEAVLATFIGDLSLFIAIKKGPLPTVATIMAVSPLITLAFAVFFLGDHITIKQLIGACLVILGIVLVV